jgi:hypothetical protein
MGEAQHPGGAGQAPVPGHELRDLRPRAIAIFLLVLAVMIAGVLLVSTWIYDYSASRLAREEAPSAPAAKQGPPPEPRLQLSGPKEMQEFRAAEEAILGSYGWVQKDAGIVRIPVGRAMDLLAARGLPPAGGTSRPAKAKAR